jgi:serine/threonine-protein kinase PpkA
MSMRRRQVIALAGAGTALVAASGVRAQPKKPLLLDGKKTLYQRVLTRPEAMLMAKAGDASGKALPPFSVYFVYERAQAGAAEWLLVGAASDGRTEGWLPATAAVPWRHMITLSFAAPTTRERVLFHRERQPLLDFMNGADPAGETTKLLKEIGAKAGTLGPTHPVIAAEPEKYVDLQKSFYLLPVLETASTVLKSGHRARLVKVASVTRDALSAAPAPASAAGAGESGIANFNSAVVFVIDATSSMQPYIERTRKAMKEVLEQAEAAKLGPRIRFGLLAFQDDPKKTKGMAYLSKVFADPATTTTRDQFMAALGQVNATANSTRAFAEDAYAALDEALRRINWQNFGGRYIVYITDASAREGNSPLASTRLATAEMRAHAQERGVAIYALHLKTPEGKADHATAEAQFKVLSNWPGVGPLYFPVEAGDPARFEADVKRMAQALVEQVRAPEKALAAARAAKSGAPAAAAPAKGDALEKSVETVGGTMALAFLGRQQGVKSPPMYEAWALDRDVRNRELPSFTVRVLLTKNQLSDLQSTVHRLSEAFGKTQVNPADLFNQLRSAAAAMGRDPSKIGQGQAKNLEQAGLMGEYLEGLPYQSKIMGMSFETWTNLPVGKSQEIIDGLKSQVVLYQRFHDDVDRWVKLNPAAGDGDRVYPVPIDALP